MGMGNSRSPTSPPADDDRIANAGTTGPSLGRQALIELYGCRAGILNDVEALKASLVRAAAASGAHVISSHFHRFDPPGVSGFLVLSESHLAIHTWPDHGFAAVDLFTCGTSVDAPACLATLAEALGARGSSIRELSRGDLASIANLTPR